MGLKTTISLLFCAAAIFGTVKKNKASGEKLSVSGSIIERRISRDSMLCGSPDSAYYTYFDRVNLTINIKLINHSGDTIKYVMTTSDYPFYWNTDSKVFYRLGSDVMNSSP